MQQQLAAARPHRRVTSHVRWAILGLLTLISFVAYLLRTNMSVAGEGIMRDLALSQVQLGWVLAAFAWGYALFQLPGGVLGDLLGGRRSLALVTALWGGLNLLVALVPSATAGGALLVIASLAGLRFLMGAAQAPLFPILGGCVIARWFPVSGWAFPNGVTNTGLTLGAAATGPLIAWLVRDYGWRASFAITAPLALLAAAAWYWFARDDPADHPAVHPAELAVIDTGRPVAIRAAGESTGWRTVLRDRNIQLITLSYFLANYVFYFFFNWLYIYLVQVRGFEEIQGGALAAAPWVTGAVAASVGGWTCDRITRRRGIDLGCRLVIIPGLLLSGGFIVAAGLAQGPYAAVVYLACCLGTQQFTDSAYWAAATSVGGRHAATACGLLNTGGNVVGGVVALLVPLTARAVGWPAALATASLFAIVAALLWFRIRAGRAMPAP
jgi:ACS family glucarate transporter-like MFS transporter